jgi:hypothetical protein
MDDHQRTKFVRISELEFDEAYQRVDNLNIARINDIAKNYDHAAVGVILVSRRTGGRLFVIDGMHRVKACLKKFGPTHQMLAVVFDGLTVEEEARLFWKQTKRTAVSPFDQHRARLAAGDSASIAMRDILGEHGLLFSRGSSQTAVQAVKIVEKIYHSTNQDDFREIVRIVATGCRLGRMTPSGLLFEGVFEFLRTYDDVDRNRLIKAIAKADGEEFNRSTSAAFQFTGSRPSSLCEAVRKEYNRGQRHKIGPDMIDTTSRRARA